LRTRLYPYRKTAQGGEDPAYHYDKIPVERVVMGDPQTPFTILRLPKVYGPGDRSCLFDYLKRMDDGREAILLGERKSRWRWTRGYVENVAAAIAVAVTDARAANRIYNLGEGDALSESEWARNIGLAAGWGGEVAAVPENALPRSMIEPYRFEQHLVAETGRFREALSYEEETPRQEALKRAIDWERANPPSGIDLKRFDYAAEDEALKLRCE
jgi:nucleoside-diphosphate-sugar epimerase